jgi:hypothetical protein
MTTESLLTAGAEPTDAATTTTAATTPAADTTAADGKTATPAADTTAKADDGKAPDAEGKPADDKPVVEGAPETYEDFKVADGVQVAPEAATEFKTLAKELNLSQEKAQKVYDAATKLAQQGQVQAETKIADTIKSTHAQWVADVKADKEIGGDKLAENLAKANAAMKATSTPQLQVLLDKSGLGNHPEVIRHFLKIAPAFSEDKHVRGQAPAGDSKSAEKVLYPNNA